MSKIFSRTPSPNRRSLKSERSPSPKSRNRLSPLFGRNSAPPSTGSGSSESTICKSICSPSSSPKLFDKSERTFNIPASLVFQSSDGKGGKHSKQELLINEIKDSVASNQTQHSTPYKENKENIENSKSTERSSNSALPVTKPPIPAPRAINQQGINYEDRFKDPGKQHTRRKIS